MKIADKLQIMKTKVNKDGYKFKDLYRLMYDEDLYVFAYERIASNKGSQTSGVDDQTINCWDNNMLKGIISSMKENQYKWKPAKRIEIPKPNGKMRPIGIPTIRDRITEGAILVILEAIWAPELENPRSFGFIKGRCTSEVADILRNKIEGAKWIIEGDFTGAFDNVRHGSVMKELSSRISDKRFLDLIKRRLMAGYMVEHKTLKNPTKKRSKWGKKEYVKTYTLHKPSIGTPQGGILSPFLFNRALDHFDRCMDELQTELNYGNQAFKTHKSINKLRYRIRRISDDMNKGNYTPDERKAKIHEISILQEELLNIDPRIENPHSRRFEWYRYADDWVVLYTGPKSEIDARIMKKIVATAKDIGISLNEEKTKITSVNEGFCFLGYKFILVDNKRYGIRKCYSKTKKTTNYQRRIRKGFVDADDRIIKRLKDKGFCDSKGFPLCKTAWITMSDERIIQKFNEIIRGLKNYYQVCDRSSKVIGRVAYILEYSLLKTFAGRHNSSLSKMRSKYGRFPVINKSITQRIVPNDLLGWKWKLQRVTRDIHQEWIDILNTTNYIQLSDVPDSHCADCDSPSNLQQHHINSLGSAGKTMKPWEYLTAANKRKTVTLCIKCHNIRTRQQNKAKDERRTTKVNS